MLLRVEGLDWDMSLRDLITAFQYAASIELEISRPLDKHNLKCNLKFNDQRRFDQAGNQLDTNSLQIMVNDMAKTVRRVNDVPLQIPKPPENPQPPKTVNSIDSLLASARRQSDMKGENAGERPVKANGNFEANDVRRFCRVCNVELPNIANYQAHRGGKKHQKRQADFDRTGKYAQDVQIAIAKGDALWQRAGQAAGGGTKQVKQETPMQREMKKVITNTRLDQFCPVCTISLSSPVVCLSHYIGLKHTKKMKTCGDEDLKRRIEELVEKLQLAKENSGSIAEMNDTVKVARMKKYQSEFRRNYEEDYNRRTEEMNRKRKLPPRPASYVTEAGMRNQQRAYSRIFNEPNPIGDDEIKEEGEVNDGDEIVEEEEVEEIEETDFQKHIDSLYKRNERF